MLMNPTLTNNFHPTFAGMGQDGIRHDLNRLYYNAEFFRNDLIDGPALAQAYPMGSYGYAPYYPTTAAHPGYYPYGVAPQYAGGFPFAQAAYAPMVRGFDPRFGDVRSWETRGFDPRFGDVRGWETRGFDPRFGDVRGWETRGFDPRFETRGFDFRGFDPRFESRYDSRWFDPRYAQTRSLEGTAVRPYDALMAGAQSPESGYTHMPATNWAEAPDAYLLVVELPGVDLKDINLQILGSSLVLNAYRRPTWSNGSVTVNYHFTEGRFGTLRRMLPLPVGVLPGQIQANFVNGLLTILIPRTAAAGANQVPQASIVINSAVPTTM